MTQPAPKPDTTNYALWIGVGGHGIAWAAYALLLIADGPTPIPAWAALALAFGGHEAILAIFSLTSMLPLYAGVQEYANDRRPRLARFVGLLCAAVALALAWRWYQLGRPLSTALAVLLALPGLVGQAPPKPVQ